MPSAVIQSPEIYADSLAQVLHREGNKISVLGQAWLIAPGRLATCGHVVEAYRDKVQGVTVKFPASGNEYPAQQIFLHPQFLRQPDQLVQYDVALICVDLKQPEAGAAFLPLRYDKPLRNQQTLFAMRYPAHLGVLSAAPTPLIQEGQLLGSLRKNDNFHLLHDLGLAPGDSGSPLFDDETVVAIHCGDTASIPGLNLPTTSIRLALWTDALKELGVSPNQNRIAKPRSAKMSWLAKENVIALALSTVISGLFFVGAFIGSAEYFELQHLNSLAPLNIEYNPQNQLLITAHGVERIYAIFDAPEQTTLIYPAQNELTTKSSFSPGGAALSIDIPPELKALMASGKGKLIVTALKPQLQLISNEDVVIRQPDTLPQLIDSKKTFAQLERWEKDGSAISQAITN